MKWPKRGPPTPMEVLCRFVIFKHQETIHRLARESCYGCGMEKAGVEILSQRDHMGGGCLSDWGEKALYYCSEAMARCRCVDWGRDMKILEPDIDWSNQVDFHALNRLLRGVTSDYENVWKELERAVEEEDISTNRWRQQFRKQLPLSM